RPRSLLQPVPGDGRRPDGRPRRRAEPHRSRPAARQGHLRSLARGTGRVPRRAAVAGGVADRAAQRPRLPAAGGCVHGGRHRHLDLVQADPRSAGPRRTAAPVGVRDVLRRVMTAASAYRRRLIALTLAACGLLLILFHAQLEPQLTVRVLGPALLLYG